MKVLGFAPAAWHRSQYELLSPYYQEASGNAMPHEEQQNESNTRYAPILLLYGRVMSIDKREWKIRQPAFR